MQPAVIVEGQPVRHWLLGLLSGGELVPMHAGRFQSASEAVGALCRASPSPCGRETALRLFSQQLRFLHIQELAAAMLAAPVAVEYQTRLWAWRLKCWW